MKKGYTVRKYNEPVKRYCQTLSLKNNPGLIAEYRRIHSRAEAWPEIRAGIRSVGILEMEIYILGSTLFMIVEAPLDFDWDEAMARCWSADTKSTPMSYTTHRSPSLACIPQPTC